MKEFHEETAFDEYFENFNYLCLISIDLIISTKHLCAKSSITIYLLDTTYNVIIIKFEKQKI